MAWMLVHPQLHNTFSALGVQHGDVYRVNEDCLAILGDILTKLSVEDRTFRSFRRAIGFGQHIRKDLLPLLIHVKDDAKANKSTEIIDATIKILVNLTIPVECLLSMEAMSKTDIGRNTIFEINKLLYSSKEAFVDSRSIKAVTDHLKFVIERGSKLEIEQCDSINNCLLLLRNILHIPEHRLQISNCPLAHASMQNRILWNLFTQSIDKLLLHLMNFPQKIYWVVNLVQLISLIYKDQHVGTLQKLLSIWWESSLSDSSDDNESNTSPPPHNQASGYSSPMLTSDPTSDSSDNAPAVKQHINRSQQNRNKVLLTSNKNREDDSSSSSSGRQETGNKKEDQHLNCSAGLTSAANNLRAQKRKLCNNRNDTLPSSSTSESSSSTGDSGKPNNSAMTIPGTSNSKDVPKVLTASSELSDYGYGTQVENQESISTSSNDDDIPQQKPIHQKPHMVQKPRNKAKNISPQDKKELRRKKLIKRSKINIVNIKGLLHHFPTDEDIANILKEFTVDFLLKGYGSLVQELHAQLLCSQPVDVDTSHIFWLVTYFLKFATQLELEFEHLEPVLNFKILAYLTYEGVHLCEEIEMEQKNKEIKPYLRRIHLVVTAIKEFLQALVTYKKLPHLNKVHQETLLHLQLQISKSNDIKCLLLLLIRQYNPKLQSKQYLQDLITTNHMLLLYLENVKTEENMVEHLKHFANVEVMYQYSLLLEDFENNGKFINDCVFTMMHHIGGDIDNVSTLFQPNILKTFSKIWDSDYETCDDWSDLIEYVIHKFINVPRQMPERCPSSNLKDSAIGTELCTSLSPPNETNDKWTEGETDALYWYYLQSCKTDRVVENVMKYYQENGIHKTRESIIQQLLEQNIISQSCFDEYMKTEHINNKKYSKETEEEQHLEEIRVLKEQLEAENEKGAVGWLQKLLLQACNCKIIIEDHSEDYENIYEPIPYCYLRLHQSIPVIPWYQEHSDMLKNKTFISLLLKLGFYLPCQTRKLFVRIPHFWTADHMFSIAQQLGPVDRGSLKFNITKAGVAKTKKEVESTAPEVPSHSQPKEDTAAFVPQQNTTEKYSNLSKNDAETNTVSLTASATICETSCEDANVDLEHNSACETTSVTSDLTRMYVSDEEDKQ